MEAPGVYWKPVWPILDDGAFMLVLANAAHVKNVPSRKTDVTDAMVVADTVAHSLIRASVEPDRPTEEMRNLMLTRKLFARLQSTHLQGVLKTLEDANIKVATVLTSLITKGGRAMSAALN